MESYPLKSYLEIKRCSSPRWSYDDSHIVYKNNTSGTFQMYIQPSKGGKEEQLTSFEDPIEFLSCSPTKNLVAFGRSSGGNEKMQIYLMDLNTRSITKISTNDSVKYGFGGWSRDGRFISYNSNERNGTDFDIFVLDLTTMECKCVFSEGGYCSSHGFSPRGTYLSVSKLSSNVDNDIYLVNLADNSISNITKHEGIAQFGSPIWLPDESSFFMRTDHNLDFNRLFKYSLESKVFALVYQSNWDIVSASINYAGTEIAVTTNSNGYEEVEIFAVNPWKSLKKSVAPGKMIGGVVWSRDSKQFAFEAESSIEPAALWIFSMDSGAVRQFTPYLCDIPISSFNKETLVNYSSFDSLSVPTFVYLPKENTNAKIPAIIYLHGGPEGQTQPSFSPLFQYFLSQGYAVVCPNIRGSTGYGKHYQSLDDRQKRMDSVKDMVALHSYLQSHPKIDGNRLALFGGSYGGFMVLAGLAFYPTLWSAGVCMVGIANFITFLQNTASYRRSLREAEYGYLKEDHDFLVSISPYNSADKIVAPLMIIHGANDPRVPLSEAEQMHSILLSKGNDIEMLVYSDEGHGLSKLKNRLDAYPKVVNFLSKHLLK